MLRTNKIIFNTISIILFTIISIILYSQIQTYATIQFQQKTMNVPGYARFGEIYLAKKGTYINRSEYILRKEHVRFTDIKKDIIYKNIEHIRIDPLRDKGEIVLKNFKIIQYDGFKKIIQNIDFKKQTTEYAHQIKILEQNKNSIHLLATGEDPYMPITDSLNINYNFINYWNIVKSFIYTLFIMTLLLLLYTKILIQKFTPRDVIIAITLLTYSIFVLLFTHHIMAKWLLIILPLISLIAAVYYEGITIFKKRIQNIFYILILLTCIVYISDIANDLQNIYRYFSFLPYILLTIFIPISFIQNHHFNINFYKYILISITILLSIFAILSHFNIIELDTFIIYGYRVSTGDWIQKNYTFWYLFLMWGTISFLHLKKLYSYDMLFFITIITLSWIMISTGYSVSAKLAFYITLLVFLLLYFSNIFIRIIKLTPILVSLYLFFMPWITNLYTYVSSIHPRLDTREDIFTLSSALVKEHIYFGYGYYSSASLRLQKYLPSDLLQQYGNPTHLHGYNPHNIPMLIWLNFGILGALLFSILIYFLLKRFIKITHELNNQSALLVLILSFVIITTFSWSGWWHIVFLTYGFFFGILFLSINNKTLR